MATCLAAMVEAQCCESERLARQGDADEASKRANGHVASSWQQWPKSRGSAVVRPPLGDGLKPNAIRTMILA